MDGLDPFLGFFPLPVSGVREFAVVLDNLERALGRVEDLLFQPLRGDLFRERPAPGDNIPKVLLNLAAS